MVVSYPALYLYGYGIQIANFKYVTLNGNIYKKNGIAESLIKAYQLSPLITNIKSYKASIPRSPVRILTASATSYINILPSP